MGAFADQVFIEITEPACRDGFARDRSRFHLTVHLGKISMAGPDGATATTNEKNNRNGLVRSARFSGKHERNELS